MASAASKQKNLHIYMVWAIFGTLEGHYSLQTVLQVKSDLYISMSILLTYMFWVTFVT